jgi:tetratricopeptide (TPR) repeat protein
VPTSHSPKVPARRWIAVSLVLAVTTLAVYWRVGGHAFLDYDDAQYVRDNQAVHGGLTWDGIAWAFTSIEYASNWHPLTWISHLVDVELFGLSPRGPHLANIVMHAGNAVLLFLLLGTATSAFWRSALVAALFAVHPLHVESVAWVSERKDVLSSLFWLLASGAYLRYARRPGGGRYAAVVVLLALGLMAKPMLVTLPLVLLLMDWWPLGRLAGPGTAPPGEQPKLPGPSPRNRLSPLLVEKLPLAALSVLSGALTLVAQRRGGSVISLQSHPLPLRLENAFVAYATYPVKTFWPSSLTALYPLGDFPAWRVAGAVLALAAATWAAVRSARRSPWLLMGWLWYLSTLLPVIGLVQVGAQAMADRYTYIPVTGLLVMIAWEAPRLLGGGRWAQPALAAAGGLAVLGCVALTRVQIGYWRDDITLFTHALAVAPDNSDARYNLGRSLLSRGNAAEAAVHLQRAVEISPAYTAAWNDLGLALKRLKRPREAVAAFEKAISLDPTDVKPYVNLGLHYLAAGDKRGAWLVYRSLQQVDARGAEGLRRFILAAPGRD